RTVRVPGEATGAGGGPGPVRAADGGGRVRVPRAAWRGRTGRLPRPRPVTRRHPARPRVLQLRGRGADRRWPVGAPRPPPGGRGTCARRRAVADVPRRHTAGTPTG